MIEIKGNLWDYYGPKHVVCITTNGTIKKNGDGVMGRGCALEATQRIPKIANVLGENLRHFGNIPKWLQFNPLAPVLSFPVKHNWWEEANLDLIRNSLLHLRDVMNTIGFQDLPFVLPRPGCGNGKLNWRDVKPLFVSVSDRVWVISK